MASNKADLRNPIYHDENAAREHLEGVLWPNGPVCPRCGVGGDRITKLQGTSTRPGVYKCKDCRKPFSVTVGTVMERSHIPLSKWVLAVHLLASSKKGMSAHQLHRMLGTTYEAAWFLFHRLREAAAETDPSGLGGDDKVIEADETFVGGKARNKAYGPPPKKVAVLTLVERKGRARSRRIAEVTADVVRPVVVTTASRKSHLRTDESGVSWKVGEEFKSHATVVHSANEYVRGIFTQYCGGIFLNPETWDLWHLSSRFRGPSAPLSCRVRFQVQQPIEARKRRPGARRPSPVGHQGQAAPVSTA